MGPRSRVWILRVAGPPQPGAIDIVDTSGALIERIRLQAGRWAQGIAAAGEFVYVAESRMADPSLHEGARINVYDQDGHLVRVIGNIGPDSLGFAGGMAARDSSVYICDVDRIRLYRPDGREIAVFFGGGAKPGSGSWRPSTIAFTSDSHLLVGDAFNHCVYEYLRDGTFVTQFGIETVHDWWFRPQFIATYPDGSGGDYLYISTPQDLSTAVVYFMRRTLVQNSAKPRLLRPGI